jgi:hypothetical protein
MEKFEDIKKQTEGIEAETEEMNTNNQNIDNNSVLNNEEGGKSGNNMVKILIALVILVGVGAGSVFAYMQVNPFFLKSKEDIFKEILTNTFDRMSQGNFIADNNMKVNFKEDSEEINFELPFVLTISEIEENNMPNIGISIGEVDISPLVYYSFGGFFPVSGNNNLSVDFRVVDESAHVRVGSVPEILTTFFPVEDLVTKYEGKWISSTLDEVESVTGAEVDNEDVITDEQLVYIFDRLSQVVIEDAKPVIESEKEGDFTKITYTSDFTNFSKAIESASADIDNYLGAEESQLGNYSESYENLTGVIEQVIYVDNSLVINRVDGEIILVDNSDGNELETRTSVTSEYTYHDNVEIDVPVSDFTIEELMGDVMMAMFMGFGGNMGGTILEGEATDDWTDTPGVEEPFLEMMEMSL